MITDRIGFSGGVGSRLARRLRSDSRKETMYSHGQIKC